MNGGFVEVLLDLPIHEFNMRAQTESLKKEKVIDV